MKYGRINCRPTFNILTILHNKFDFVVNLINLKGFVKILQFFIVGESSQLFICDENDKNIFVWKVK